MQFLDEETADNFCTTVVTDKIYLQEKQRYIYMINMSIKSVNT